MIKKLSTILDGWEYIYIIQLHIWVKDEITKREVARTIIFGCDTMDDVLKCIRENYRNGEWIYIQEKKK